MFSLGRHRTTPDTLPDRRFPAGLTHQLDRKQEYGSTFGLLQARRLIHAACDSTIPGSAIAEG